MKPGRVTPVLLLAAGLATGAAAGSKALRIEPGPTAQSPEELAIRPNPVAGAEHGVILVTRTIYDEGRLGETRVTHHLRAKILSNEGRDLANVEIPVSKQSGKLKQWWGRTILPDGTVHELDEKQLERQSVARFGRTRVSVLKGALPAVEPGCVIDYGYEYHEDGLAFMRRVEAQTRWPVREFRYHWKPNGVLPAATLITNSEGLDLRLEPSPTTVLIEGNDLPAVFEEPLMPPLSEVQAAVYLYYRTTSKDPAAYWKARIEDYRDGVDAFNKKKSVVRKALQSITLPPDDDWEGRARAIYDWIEANIQHAGFRMSEDVEADTGDDDDKKVTAADVLGKRMGTSWQIDKLFIGLARAAGLEAQLVPVTDRSEHYWNPSLMSIWQFDGAVVAVHPAGTSLEEAIFVDPGSGLPFGEVPWYFSGSRGLAWARDGAKGIVVPAAQAEHNVSRSVARIEFAEDYESMLIGWTREGTGQRGLLERRGLRGLAPDERQERLYKLCGDSETYEVDEAEAPDLDRDVGQFRLACSGERFDTRLDEETGRYSMHFSGAWVEHLPDLPEGKRRHPVIFQYPRTDVTEVEVTAPEGFVPVTPAEPVAFESPAGSYDLVVQATADGFTVKRRFVLKALAIDAGNYDPLIEFFKQIRRHDDTMLVFERGEKTGG